MRRGAADLRGLGWSSIDNDTSRDLDQIEVAERVPTGIRVHVAIGDVAAAVEKDSPIDEHAQAQTQTIYTAVKNFPMLPLELSAGLTSLNENERSPGGDDELYRGVEWRDAATKRFRGRG